MKKITAKQKKKAAEKEPAIMGRPTKYRPEYCQEIIRYFTVSPLDSENNPVPPPYFQEFCLSIGITKPTLHYWIDNYPDFSYAYSVAKEKQKQLIITNALLGGYNASFAWRAMANMHGWRDEKDLNVKGDMKIEIIDHYDEDSNDQATV